MPRAPLPRSSADSSSAVAAGALFGGYWLLLGCWRSLELASLPDDAVVAGPFPSWLLTYLEALVGAVTLGGLAMVVGAVLLRRGDVRGSLLVAGGGLSNLGTAAAHAYFTFGHDVALGEGGLVWGIVHVATLTRTWIPGGATESGAAGFRVGQAVGFVVWALASILVVASALDVFVGPKDAAAARE